MWDRVPLFWRFQFGGWTAFVILTLPIKLAVSSSVVATLGSYAVRDGFSLVLTLGMRVIYNRIYQNHGEPVWIAGTVAIVSVTAGLMQLPIFYLFGDVFPFEEKTLFGESVGLGIFYYRTALFAGWSLLYFSIRKTFDGMERDLRLTLIESEKRSAELQMLRAQMNPHFILNALNTILASVGRDVRHAKALICALAQYLQFSLKNRANDLVPLNEELEAVRGFLEVECARHPGDWIIECAVDDRTLNDLVPGIFLQPLIENAMKYGKLTSPKPRRLFLRTSNPSAGTLAVEVRNSGHWIRQEKTDDPARGIGLSNLRQRLEALYPGRHTFAVDEQDGWVSVRIEVPLS